MWMCPVIQDCGCEHKWTCEVKHRTRKDKKASGCPFCAINTTRVCVHKSLFSTHSELLKEWH